MIPRAMSQKGGTTVGLKTETSPAPFARRSPSVGHQKPEVAGPQPARIHKYVFEKGTLVSSQLTPINWNCLSCSSRMELPRILQLD
jgi:hypothetical protein